MTLKQDVLPITELKNHTAELVRQVAEEGRTVVITQNGKAKAVMMDVDAYDRWQAALALLKIVAQGEADVRAGRTLSHRDAVRRAAAAVERAGKHA